MRDEERSDDARIQARCRAARKASRQANRARRRASEPSTWREARLYLGIAGWVVLTVILGIQTAAYMGWLG